MNLKNKSLSITIIFLCLAFISLSFTLQITRSQAPLSLAQVLTGLQSNSGGFTLSQKNEFITKRVQELGVTFRLTPEIEKELRQAGASPALLQAIRLKSAGTRPTPRPSVQPEEDKPNVQIEKLWVEQNVVENGIPGIRIYANFNVYNMKEVQSDIVYRFQRDGKFLTSTNVEYKTQAGELSTRRLLKPAYTTTVYEDLDAFIPYKEFNLSVGTHNLKIDADVILRDGTMVKHLALQDLRLVIPSPTLKKGSATFEKMWIDYNVTLDNKLGMTVHVKTTVRDLKDQDIYLQLLFEKQDGTKLFATDKLYKSPEGQTAAYKRLRPIYESAVFNDISVFIPYTEFNLPVGQYNLRIHADLIYTDYSTLQHLEYYDFTYSRNK